MRCPNCGHDVVAAKPKRKGRLSREESLAMQRGCWVPDDKAEDWKTLKAAGYSAEEARVALDLPPFEASGNSERRTVPVRKVKAAGTDAKH